MKKVPIRIRDVDDEETIIAEPKPQMEEKKPEPKPEPKVYSQPTQSSYTHVSHVSNESEGSGKGVVIAMVVVFFFVIIILASYRGCGNKAQEINQQSVENAEPQTVEKMSWESPLGNGQYTGSVNGNNIPDGYGEFFFEDQRYYRGDFEQGELTGDNCYFRYSNGDVFEGKFRNNTFYYGKYKIAEDGSYYIGHFDDQGQPNNGKWYSKNGNVIENV